MVLDLQQEVVANKKNRVQRGGAMLIELLKAGGIIRTRGDIFDTPNCRVYRVYFRYFRVQRSLKAIKHLLDIVVHGEKKWILKKTFSY